MVEEDMISYVGTKKDVNDSKLADERTMLRNKKLYLK